MQVKTWPGGNKWSSVSRYRLLQLRSLWDMIMVTDFLACLSKFGTAKQFGLPSLASLTLRPHPIVSQANNYTFSTTTCVYSYNEHRICLQHNYENEFTLNVNHTCDLDTCDRSIEEQILTPIMIMVLWSKFHCSFFMPSQHSTQWLIAYLQYTSSSHILKLIVQYHR